MPIKFRQPQDINAIRFGATLVWGAVNGIITTIQGTSPLALVNAVTGRIKSLVQYGKCTTVDDEIYCNNGKLVIVDDELPAEYQRQIGFKFAASTYYRILDFHLRGTDTVRISFSVDKACNVFGCYTNTSAEDNYSLYASTSSGGKYLRYDGSTYNSYIPSAQVGERIDAIITPNGTSGMPTDSVITPTEFEAAADLCIGTTSTSASSSKLDGNIWGSFVVDGRLTLIPCERLSDNVLGYYDPDSDTFYEPVGSAPTSLGVDSSHLTALSVVGTPEVLTVGEQTATVENLLAVDDIKDEQNIISGTVTRRCEALISDGTTPSGRYIGEVGDGNIIVKVRETGYEGDVATFEADSAKPLNGLTVNVEPIQDLHGYDSPWPAGGGKNLLQVTATTQTKDGITFTVNSDGTVSCSGTANADGWLVLNNGVSFMANVGYIFNGCPSGGGSSTYNLNFAGSVAVDNGNGSAVYTPTEDKTWIARLQYKSGTNMSGLTFKPMLRLSTASDATFAPYSNICPIFGRTSATVTRTGRNLLDDSDMQILTTQLRIARDEGLGGNPFLLKGGCTYTLSCNSSKPASAIYLIKPYTSVRQAIAFRFNSRSITYAPEEDIEVGCVLDWSNGRPEDATHLMLEVGSTATAYEPYHGNTYTIQLGDTVYGGTLDVTGGKMVVDRTKFSPTVNYLQSVNSYGIANFRGTFYENNTPYAKNNKKNFKCNCLPTQMAVIANTQNSGVSLSNRETFYIRLPETEVATVEAANAWISAHNLEICYMLESPVEITLTPTQIDTLLGTNNIWSDAGAVKAYVADGNVIEHVTAQPLRTAEGNNTVAVTSAVAPVQLEIDYYKDE